MGSLYKDGINPFCDVLMHALSSGIDISNAKQDIQAVFEYILENVLEDNKVGVYLDFDILNDNGYFKVVGNNALTALWLSGIFVKDVNLIMKNNIFIIKNRKYKYNKKKHELTYIEIYE